MGWKAFKENTRQMEALFGSRFIKEEAFDLGALLNRLAPSFKDYKLATIVVQ